MAAVRESPRDTAVPRGLWAEGGTALPQGLVQPRDRLVEPGYVLPGGPTDDRTDALVHPVPFLDPLSDPLPTPAQPLLQLLTFLFALRRTGV